MKKFVMGALRYEVIRKGYVCAKIKIRYQTLLRLF
jgi:hypothetical protein